MLRWRSGVGVAMLAGLFSVDCLPVRYVTQAAAGQDRLSASGVSIQQIVDEGRLDRRTRMLLSHVPRIKAFGERFGLRHTTNYERYVRLDRPAVVWVVSACDPLSFRPRAWRFPIVGSITYTGWFSRADARSYADELAEQGWDVDVRPSQAYSTLGWFDDPILSTMLADDGAALGDLADVVLHETLHATFYVPNQSTLNESVAAFFGDELALRYLDEVAGAQSTEKAAFVERRRRSEARGAVMKAAYDELAELYRSSLPREEKICEKQRIFATLAEKTRSKRPMTNATLIQYKTYGSGKAELDALFQSCRQDFPAMLRRLETLRLSEHRAAPHSDPGKLLRPLLSAPCVAEVQADSPSAQ